MCRQYLLTYLLIVTFYSLLNYVYFIVFCWTYDMYICKNLMVFIMSSKHCMLMNMVCIGICFKSRFFNVIFTMLCGSAPFHTCYVKKKWKNTANQTLLVSDIREYRKGSTIADRQIRVFFFFSRVRFEKLRLKPTLALMLSKHVMDSINIRKVYQK